MCKAPDNNKKKNHDPSEEKKKQKLEDERRQINTPSYNLNSLIRCKIRCADVLQPAAAT